MVGDFSTTPHHYSLRNSKLTTYRVAINEIRRKISNASPRDIHMYTFNIPPDQLEAAHALLDKADGRKLMRVTYNDDYNFIVKYMPSPTHEQAHTFWATYLLPTALMQLVAGAGGHDIRCSGTGSMTYQLGPRRKQADAGIRPHPNPPGFPSIVMEVGSSETLSQLRIDAACWLEHNDHVMLVILISIDHPIPPFPKFPRITIQLWRGFPSNRPVRPHAGQDRVAVKVWEADWTNAATPFYILLSDIFRGPPPPDYGNNDRVFLNTQYWREAILNPM